MTYRSPQPCGLSKESVYQIAEHLAKELEFEPGGDIRSVVDSLGGTIEYKDFWGDGGDSGSAEINSLGNFKIYVSSYTNSSRDKFTIAHELGHYVLHYFWHLEKGRNPGPTKANRYGSNRVEWEANWFAAAFLMPSAAFKTACARSRKNGRIDFGRVAAKFGVSELAAETRAKALVIS